MVRANLSSAESEAAHKIRAQLQSLPKYQQETVIRGAREELIKINAERAQLQARRESLIGHQSRLAANCELEIWLKKPFILQKNDCSRAHRLEEAFAHGKILAGGELDTTWTPDVMKGVQSIVVTHDWARAFEHATDYDGEFKLPYEHCLFEFRVSGRNVAYMASDDGVESGSAIAVECGDYWAFGGMEEPLKIFLRAQAKAICVALDAEVATKSMVRAPHALNAKREKQGKGPLYSYHVVDLNRKTRANRGPHSADQTRKRLHFRRGHWRHFTDFKTWVRWCLVGDPDLGFVDKEYRI